MVVITFLLVPYGSTNLVKLKIGRSRLWLDGHELSALSRVQFIFKRVLKLIVTHCSFWWERIFFCVTTCGLLRYSNFFTCDGIAIDINVIYPYFTSLRI